MPLALYRREKANRLRRQFDLLISALACCLFLFSASLCAQQVAAHDAAWPDPLVLQDGVAVHDGDTFERERRPEILHMFEENVFGRTPQVSLPVQVVASETDDNALGGLARRSQITIAVGLRGERTWHLLIYLPAAALGPVPVVVGLNFDGNQTVSADPGIRLYPVWKTDPELAGTPLAKELCGHTLAIPDATSRGSAASQWQVEMLLRRGYALATLYAGDIEPDFISGMGYGVRPLFMENGQAVPRADDWGAIGAWAWGMSRIVDVISADPKIDAHRIIGFGFSRFGKTALWASAQDRRFAITLSNESGQAGATLSHRQVGESIDHLMLAFPYWFCANYQHFLGNTRGLPVDGHLLLSLIAPRPLYVGSALADPFSDYLGEFFAAKAVTPVYALFGEAGLPDLLKPPINQSIGATVGYHLRPGGHDVTAFDWERYLDFADRQFGLAKKSH